MLSGFLAAWLLGSGAAAAQETPVQPTRGDVHFVIGWQNLRREQPQNSNDWVNAIFYGGTGLGWYWTDHMKTQIDFGAGTEGRQYRYEQEFSPNAPFQSSELTLSARSVAIGQQYQFFRNQWFHPHVGAGVEIARETTTEHYDPVFVFDNAARTTRTLVPARTEGPDHRVVARPFLQTGFKAYMSRRSFFTTDARVMIRGGIDEVLFRLGFGIDF